MAWLSAVSRHRIGCNASGRSVTERLALPHARAPSRPAPRRRRGNAGATGTSYLWDNGSLGPRDMAVDVESRR